MVEIIPAILTQDLKEVEEKIRICEGNVDRIQIDILDGQFAENKTIDPSALESIDTQIKLDFHLMTKEPSDWVERCVRGGADRIIGQIEMMESQADFIEKVTEAGLSVGLAIDIETLVSSLDPTILNNLDVVLVMSVKAGFGGQEFDKRSIDKIRILNEIRTRDIAPFKICVDGGETTNTIDDIHFQGAQEVVIGKRIFEGNLRDNINKFQKAAHKVSLM